MSDAETFILQRNLRIPCGHKWHVACRHLLVRNLAMRANDAKTVHEQCDEIACECPAIARPTLMRLASFGNVAGLLLLVGSISACSTGFGTGADSLQTTLGSGANSTSAETAREKIVLEGMRFKPD